MANEPPSAGNKNDVLIVGCKLATGYLAEIIPIPEREPHNWNPKPAGPRVTFAGANQAAETASLGGALIRVNPRVLNYGRTIVNRSFWEQWCKQDTAKALLDKGFIFAEAKQDDFRAHAKANLPEKTGLEGLSPEGNDERIRKVALAGQPETRIETDAEHLKRLRESMDQAA